ncbi:MAG: TIGR03643 family protein [Myxococcota bacterium]
MADHEISAREALENEVIAMAWADDVTFDAIRMQTGYTEPDVIALMRRRLKSSSFRLWRKRVTGRKTKHRAQLR